MFQYKFQTNGLTILNWNFGVFNFIDVINFIFGFLRFPVCVMLNKFAVFKTLYATKIDCIAKIRSLYMNYEWDSYQFKPFITEEQSRYVVSINW